MNLTAKSAENTKKGKCPNLVERGCVTDQPQQVQVAAADALRTAALPEFQIKDAARDRISMNDIKELCDQVCQAAYDIHVHHANGRSAVFSVLFAFFAVGL